MESVLSKAYRIKIQNFEGPLDLLFHLIEKNKIDIYDIPIDEITDQYMDYLFKMQELDLEIASEFLLMATTLLHIKSKLLLPNTKKETEEDQIDPREELVLKLVEYKRYKKFSKILSLREEEHRKVFYKLPEEIDIKTEDQPINLSYDELTRIYVDLMERNEKKTNKNTKNMTQILQHEKVSLKSKIQEVVRTLFNKTFFKFSDVFSRKTKSRLEIVTGFLAVLELAKIKKLTVKQNKNFSEIIVCKREDSNLEDIDEEKIAAEN
ncbi:segregation/condensation protein A [Herbivorax sp. ANBcel31]|uniref:segregation and condensation protein A n=1 Tax=Herbivorax sp. ANBcel31 TaxID=3069754 RepID=UPI0027B4E49E|nr:segregation/condensation protein A [Herbivorax sp. ANBcel31]MDQ2085751.1 segregation/condensation protein A [Herbivorax sp. ANBcel31]